MPITSDQRPAATLSPPATPADATSDFKSQASSAQQKVQVLQATAARIATFPEAQKNSKGGDLSALIAAQLAEAKDVQSSLSDLGKTADKDGVADERDWVASQFEAATAVAQGSINSPGVNAPNTAANLHDIQSTLGDAARGYNGYSHAAPSPGTQDQQAIGFLKAQVGQQGGAGVVSPDNPQRRKLRRQRQHIAFRSRWQIGQRRQLATRRKWQLFGGVATFSRRQKRPKRLDFAPEQSRQHLRRQERCL